MRRDSLLVPHFAHLRFLKCPFSSFIKQPLNRSGEDYAPDLCYPLSWPWRWVSRASRIGFGGMQVRLLTSLAFATCRYHSAPSKSYFNVTHSETWRSAPRSAPPSTQRSADSLVDWTAFDMLFFQTEEFPKKSTNSLYIYLINYKGECELFGNCYSYAWHYGYSPQYDQSS